jgi:NTP pyrophosphatase (non-canonical NTP hydrolase)
MTQATGLSSLQDLADRFERASQAYVAAFGLRRDADWYILKLQEEVGELTQAWSRLSGRARTGDRSEEELKAQLADETADVLGHILLLARNWEVDLAPAIRRKWRFDLDTPES